MKTLWVIIAIIVIILVFYLFSFRNRNPNPNPTETLTPVSNGYQVAPTISNSGSPLTPLASASPEQVETSSVSISNFIYDPAQLTVKVGTTVNFKNNDSVAHTVTAAGKFDSGLIAPGATYSRTFTEKGTFNYICTPHPWMKGIIVVE